MSKALNKLTDDEGKYCEVACPTCADSGLALLEGNLCLPTAGPDPARRSLHPPPPGPAARTTRHAAVAPAPPGRPAAGVAREGGAEVPVPAGGGLGVAPVERFALPPFAVVQAGLQVARLAVLGRAVVTVCSS